MSQKSYLEEKAKLYLIPTPIGNVDDITIRALNLLKEVDYILCEDTRTTNELLKKLNIKNNLIACHDHNEAEMGPKVIKLLDEGHNIGLVTDQGSPIISDPGYKVVDYLTTRGYSVIALPGATAFVPALIASGINPQPFMFYGFLNAKKSQREKELENLKRLKGTIIFYEAPHRINEMLESVREILGNRKISVSREISKYYEEIYRGHLDEVLDEIKDGVKGELVVVVEGNNQDEDYSNMTILEHINLYIEDGLSDKDAIKKVAKERNIAKSIVYKEYHTGKWENVFNSRSW